MKKGMRTTDLLVGWFLIKEAAAAEAVLDRMWQTGLKYFASIRNSSNREGKHNICFSAMILKNILESVENASLFPLGNGKYTYIAGCVHNSRYKRSIIYLIQIPSYRCILGHLFGYVLPWRSCLKI